MCFLGGGGEKGKVEKNVSRCGQGINWDADDVR